MKTDKLRDWLGSQLLSKSVWLFVYNVLLVGSPGAGKTLLARAMPSLLPYSCQNCGSQKIVKNGHNAYGNQQFWCKDSGKRGVLEPKHSYSAEQKEQILATYTNERSSMRGI